ncbi:MAG: hypothetical protein HY782_17775 [Chloroflexi bacterium]|nr:hypothetical protein [Chloroflexota bacterium]
MSLVAFHKFLIATGIVFCAGYALRQVSHFRATGDSGALVAAIVFGAAALGLGLYLNHLHAILRIPSERAGPRPSKPMPAQLADNVPRPPGVSPLTGGDTATRHKDGRGNKESTKEAE